mmetsp:Transcript_127445/g.318201  ORF Transcript_127445/g.318201 Transcript_127445/m.318201 type:complete len:223 (-) Transcript_127445:114-782(-)
MPAVALVAAYVVFIILFAVGICWLWPDFVDCSDPPQIRWALHLILALLTLMEVSIWLSGVLKPWMILVILLCNGWGLWDAFLRFPIVHDLDSLFSLKQVCLVTLKLCGYALGFRNVGKYVGWFVLIVLCCVFLVPILWLTALPIGDVTSYHQKHDAVDMDIAVRLYRACCNPTDRAAAVARCRAKARSTLVVLVQACPCLKGPALRWDPSLARMVAQGGRAV